MREEGRSFVEINGKVKKAKNKEKADNKLKNKIKVIKKKYDTVNPDNLISRIDFGKYNKVPIIFLAERNSRRL